MRQIAGVLLAVVLTLPVYLLLTRIPAIPEWFFSDRGYAVLNPLFNLFGAVGVEGHEDVIAGVLLILSFVVSCAVVGLGWRLRGNLKATR